MSNQVTKTDLYTLTYDSGVQGFPSFYSYFADWMIGMNNFFYSFKGGDLYRHNTNPIRNQYYGINYPSKVQSVFNDQPLENKLFKTINLEGDDAWGVVIESDQQDTGFIEASYFEEKEGSFYAFIRNEGTVPASLDEYALRSLNGLGSTSSVTTAGNTQTLNYPNTLYIGNIISVGDMIYYGNPTPLLAGQITTVTQDLPNGINQIIIDTSIAGAIPIPSQQVYTLYIKNAVSESHGILGHYGVFTVTNNNTNKVELFAVESEAMKSFP
tara:strand:- start:1181 stop:1987 length:807 start_codon:yes stop_codon:yes gene_type:complete